MKRNLFLSAILALCVGLVSCDKKEAASPAGGTTEEKAGGKIAYINNDSLFTYYKFAEDRLKTLEAKGQDMSKKLQVRAQGFQQQVLNVQQRAQGGLLSQNDLNREQQRLAKMEQELQMAQQSQAQGLMAEEAAVKKEIYDNIVTYLKKYSEGKDFSVILGYQEGTNIWLAPGAVDITQDVIDGLNKEYADKGTTPADSTSKK